MRRQTMGDPLSRSNDGENDDDSGDRDACLYCHKVGFDDEDTHTHTH